MLAIFSTTPRDRTSIGANACVTASRPHTFTSNSCLALTRSVSSSGMTNMLPALLTSTSRRPPVWAATAATHDAIDAGSVTSSGSTSMRPGPARELASSAALDGSRSVASTWNPRRAKASARAAPRPPSLQPVMRTVRVGILEAMMESQSACTRLDRRVRVARRMVDQ
jgi:hypothetical protein